MFGFFEKKEDVNFKELVKLGAVIVDVRSKEEFDIISVKGAINIPLDVLPVNLAKITGKEGIVIVCCASGNRSSIAKNALNTLGYKNIYNGGGWQSLQSKLQ